MSDSRETYDIEPDDSDSRKSADKPRTDDSPPPSPDKPGRPSLEAPRLLDEFDDDEDLTSDPEVEAVTKPSAATRFAKALLPKQAADDSRPPFVKVGLGTAKVWGIVGGVLLVGAVIAAAVTSPHARIWQGVYVVYSTLLHSGTGLLALTAAAALHGERLAHLALSAARILSAVAAAHLVYHLNLNIIGGTRIDDAVLGVAAYLLVMMVTFRLWGSKILAVLACHFMLWMAFIVGSEMRNMIRPPPSAPAATR